jgi:hypothetical protein
MNHWWVLARRLPVPLASASVLWILALILGQSIWGGLSVRKADLQGRQQALQSALAALDERRRDEADIRRLTPQAHALARLGVWGTADRAAWVQALQQIQAQVPLGETMGYSLGPPRQVGAEGGTVVGDASATGGSPALVAVSWHDLSLFGSTPDEELFLRFTRSAERSMPGRFRVESCEIKHDAPLPLAFQCQWRFVTLAPSGNEPGQPGAVAPLPSAPVRHPLHLAELRPLGTLLFSPQERARMRQTGVADAGEGNVLPAPPPLRTIRGLIAREGKPPLVWESGGDGNPRAQTGLTGPHANAGECGRWRWQGQRLDAGDSLDMANKVIAPGLSASGVQRGSSPPGKCRNQP